MERARKILSQLRKIAGSITDSILLFLKTWLEKCGRFFHPVAVFWKRRSRSQKILIVIGLCLISLLLLALIIAALILRPAVPPTPLSIPQEELQSIQKTSAKFSGAIVRSRRHPQKSVTVLLNEQETQAMLSSARRVFNPHLRKKVYLRDITLCNGKLVCHAEIKINDRWMIPAEIIAESRIADGKLQFNLECVHLGALRVPVFPFQNYVNRELERFGATTEGRILADFVRQADFTSEGGLKIEATGEGFKFLRERLCKN